MSDNRAEYEIVIRTILEGSGIKLTDEQFKKLTQTLREANAAHQGAGEAVDKHAHSHRELHVAAHALAGRFPHLSAVLWAFRSPLVAVSLSIGVLIEAFVKWKEKMAAAAAEARSFDQLNRTLVNWKTDAIESATAIAEWNAELAKIKGNAETVETALGKVTKKIEDQLKVQQEQLTIETTLAKLRIDANQNLSEQEKLQAKANIDKATIRKTSDLDINAKARMVEETDAALKKQREVAENEELGVPAAKAEADAAEARRKQAALNAEKDKEGIQKRLEELLGKEGKDGKKGKIAELEEAAQRMESHGDWHGVAVNRGQATDVFQEQARIERQQKAEDDLTNAREEAARLKQGLLAADTPLSRATAEAERAKKAAAAKMASANKAASDVNALQARSEELHGDLNQTIEAERGTAPTYRRRRSFSVDENEPRFGPTIAIPGQLGNVVNRQIGVDLQTEAALLKDAIKENGEGVRELFKGLREEQKKQNKSNMDLHERGMNR